MEQSFLRDLLESVLEMSAERGGSGEEPGVGDVAVEEEASELGPGGEGETALADVEVLEDGGQHQGNGEGRRRRGGGWIGLIGLIGLIGRIGGIDRADGVSRVGRVGRVNRVNRVNRVCGVVGVVDVLEVVENDLENGDAERAVVVEEAARGRREMGRRVGFRHLGSDLVETFQENEDVVQGRDSDLKEFLELR